MSAYLLPAFIALNFIVGAIRRVPVFDAFIEGAKEAVSLAVRIFPYLAAVLIAVSLFKESGLSVLLARAASPLFDILGIPPELTDQTQEFLRKDTCIQRVIFNVFKDSDLEIYQRLLR